MPSIQSALFMLLAGTLFGAAAHAQGVTPSRAADPISDDARVSLLTILPGDQIYSLWGHSAIRVSDPLRGIDVSFNYGTFRFDRYFLPNFLYGRLDYMLSVHRYDLALDAYAAEGRPVIEQELRLTPAQKDSLFRFLEINARPENRVYRYHFVYDNCSTRIRDALERSLGTAIRFSAEPDPGLTFRQLLDSALAHRSFLDAGIDWLFGAPIDRIAQPYETMFLPLYLMEAFNHATIRSTDSLVPSPADTTTTGEAWAPLVARTDTVLWIPRYGQGASTFPWASVTTWLLFFVGLGTTVRGIRSRKGVVRLLDTPLFTLVGTAGLIIVFLWFVSLHDVTEKNWHLLWAWPTHLVAAAAMLRRRRPPWLHHYLLAAAVLALAAAVPLWGQWVHPALYPLMLLVAIRGIWIFISAKRAEQAPLPV